MIPRSNARNAKELIILRRVMELEMRLVKLSDAPIRVEGKFGAIIIEDGGNAMIISTKPDTGCHSKLWQTEALGYKGFVTTDQNGHTILLEKRP
jgi:hypothetical protein